MTIYEIKRRAEAKGSMFFLPDTLRFFGQTLKSFHVYRQGRKYLIIAESGGNRPGRHYTKRLFNPKTNELELVD